MDQTDRGAEESLPLDAMRRIYAVCVSFEKAWQAEQGPRPRIEDFLDGATGAERGALLRWLLQVELGYRLARGDCPVPPDYEARFPGFEPLIRQEIGKRRPGARLLRFRRILLCRVTSCSASLGVAAWASSTRHGRSRPSASSP